MWRNGHRQVRGVRYLRASKRGEKTKRKRPSHGGNEDLRKSPGASMTGRDSSSSTARLIEQSIGGSESEDHLDDTDLHELEEAVRQANGSEGRPLLQRSLDESMQGHHKRLRVGPTDQHKALQDIHAVSQLRQEHA